MGSLVRGQGSSASPARDASDPVRDRRVAMAACVLFLLGLEVVSRSWIVDRVAGTTAGEVAALDTALDLVAEPPAVIFLGSSHTKTGVASRRIEELLGWPRGSVLNAGLQNARPRDVLRLYGDTAGSSEEPGWPTSPWTSPTTTATG